MPSARATHYELILPNPVAAPNSKRPESVPLAINATAPSWLEVHRVPNGKVRFLLGGPSEDTFRLAIEALRQGFPGLALGRQVGCPALHALGANSALLRAIPLIPDRSSASLRVVDAFDAGSLLLRRLTSDRLAGTNLVLQILFRPTFRWELGRFSGPWWGFGRDREDPRGVLLTNRAEDFPYQVEIRVAASRVSTELLARGLEPWIHSWTSESGTVWWTLANPRPRHTAKFAQAIATHDIFRMASPRCRRDLSAGELAAVLPFPWKERHPDVAYVGAPAGSPPIELVAGPPATGDLVLGRVGNVAVRLPEHWHHLAVVGKTGAGKSTLVRSIVLQILDKEPDARVVVLEPTGDLIESVVGRLAPEAAAETVEIDPSRASFTEGGVEQIAVPLNLLDLPNRSTMDASELERRAEKLVGDLVQSIKNAWGEESIGGRADFVLRSFVQALLPLEGINLVDVHAVLTEKAALARLERPGVRTDARPLPRLANDLTISSVDKVGKIAGNPVLRKALCQRYGAVGFGELLRRRLVLLNLRTGQVGTEGAEFLGAILLTQIWAALQERAGLERGAAPSPVYLVVDEFQHYAIPAFAAMLSEGRRLGLRVIAATQTLDGIPERVLPALIGNVDAWVMFPLGANDQRDGWKIVQGRRFGWMPDDLAEGPLGRRQSAYAACGTLLKVTMADPLRDPPPAVASTRRAAVDRSTRRYARPEDSEVSPLAVTQSQRVALLGALSPDEGTAREELADRLLWAPPWVDAALALARVTADIAFEPESRVRLLPRGRLYRESVLAARNEGEEHCALLADVGAWLQGLGISMRVVPQEGGFQLPDGEFVHAGRVYAVEVESSSLEKHPGQVLANVRKAVGAGQRCLLVTRDRAAAERCIGILRAADRSALLTREVAIVFRAGPGEMVPLAADCHAPWAWLGGHVDLVDIDEGQPRPIDCPGPVLPATPNPRPLPRETDLEFVRRLVRQLLDKGSVEAVAADFVAEAGDDGVHLVAPHRLGMALSSLGARSYRTRRSGGQIRVYDLRSIRLDPATGTDTA